MVYSVIRDTSDYYNIPAFGGCSKTYKTRLEVWRGLRQFFENTILFYWFNLDYGITRDTGDYYNIPDFWGLFENS